jgi:hypothetical protein
MRSLEHGVAWGIGREIVHNRLGYHRHWWGGVSGGAGGHTLNFGFRPILFSNSCESFSNRTHGAHPVARAEPTRPSCSLRRESTSLLERFAGRLNSICKVMRRGVCRSWST